MGRQWVCAAEVPSLGRRVAAQADHGQKQVTSGRTNRGSLTQGPITEAGIRCGAS